MGRHAGPHGQLAALEPPLPEDDGVAGEEVDDEEDDLSDEDDDFSDEEDDFSDDEDEAPSEAEALLRLSVR